MKDTELIDYLIEENHYEVSINSDAIWVTTPNGILSSSVIVISNKTNREFQIVNDKLVFDRNNEV